MLEVRNEEMSTTVSCQKKPTLSLIPSLVKGGKILLKIYKHVLSFSSQEKGRQRD